MRGLLTRRGWGVVIGAAVLVLAGRSLGLVELYVLAAGSLGLVVGGAVYVLTRHPDLEASRQLNPPRVHVGDNSRVELSIRNRSRRRSPVLALRDALAGGPRQARFLLPPLAPGQTDSASYRLPADRRGVFTIGPLEAERSDPFGLARRSSAIAPVAELTVYPRIDRVRPLPDSPGRDRHHTTPRAAAVGLTGEDFYALRAYQQGDDLRRVHWPSTARRDEIMIRQNEVPWQGRATIVLDIRARLHTDASLEAAVSAAASVITACWQHGSVVRLVTTDGVDSGFGSGPGHLEVILARLAVLAPVGDAGPGPRLARAQPGGRRGGGRRHHHRRRPSRPRPPGPPRTLAVGRHPRRLRRPPSPPRGGALARRRPRGGRRRQPGLRLRLGRHPVGGRPRPPPRGPPMRTLERDPSTADRRRRRRRRAGGPRGRASAGRLTPALAEISLAAGHGRRHRLSHPAVRRRLLPPPVVGAALASHALAGVVRRRGLNPIVAAAISGVGLVLYVAWVIEPHTLTLGIPGGETLTAVTTDLRAAWDRFGSVVAPAPVSRGFVLACALGAWLAAWLADLFAFRVRARFEAVVPSFVLLLFGAMLGTERHRIGLTAAYLGAILAFVVLADAGARTTTGAWFGTRGAQGDGAVLRAAAVVGLAAVLAGVVVGPRLPGADSPSLFGIGDKPGARGAARVTVSPLVDIRGRLVNPSGAEVFTVGQSRRPPTGG